MAIAPNRMYNDPALGRAFSSLAAAFAPPSGSDLMGYASAAAKREEASRLAELYAAAGSPNFDQTVFDRQAIATGLYNPTQGYYAQDQNNATARYGIDTSAATSRANNAADNVRALEDRRMQEAAAMERLGVTDATARYGIDTTADTSRANNTADNERALMAAIIDAATSPVSQGAIRPAFDPADFGVQAPAVPEFSGGTAPLNESQQKAIERQALIDNGVLTDNVLLETILGEKPPVQAVGPDGTPVFMSPGAAVNQGAQPYNEAKADVKVTNGMALLPDGSRVPAFQRPGESIWRHAQTGEQLPHDAQIFNTPQPQGSADDIGLGKPVSNNIQKQLIDIRTAKDTAIQLRDLIKASPASQGAVGWLRGTAQNVIQMGGEVGQYFGGEVANINKRIAEGLEDASLGGAFDENIPAIEMMANLLAFQYAKTTNSDRLSNEMLQASRRALGLDGLTANQASSLARLDKAVEAIERQENMLLGILRSGIGGDETAVPPPVDEGAAPVYATNPDTGERLQLIDNQWVPVP